MTKRLDGKTAVVTGAAAGLGRAIALAFAREGARIVIADIDDAGMAETAAQIAALKAECETHRVDMSQEAEIKAFGSALFASHEGIDVLINNAGIAYGEISTGFADLSMEKWLYYLRINTVAPLMLSQALRPALARTKGLIINQSSIAANVPATAYGVTKAALNAMTFGMANQFASDGIRVNAVAPGIMETPAGKAFLDEEHYKRIQTMQLLPALHGEADDIANLHLFLASPEGRFINCELMSCDAGSRLRGWRY